MRLWKGLKFDTWTDYAKYAEENRKLFPRAGIASRGIPDTENK